LGIRRIEKSLFAKFQKKLIDQIVPLSADNYQRSNIPEEIERQRLKA
jgi:hypothetical protein